MLKKKKRLITGPCDVFLSEPVGPEGFDGEFKGDYCKKPARRLYRGEFGGMGDRWYCTEHMELYIKTRMER